MTVTNVDDAWYSSNTGLRYTDYADAVYADQQSQPAAQEPEPLAMPTGEQVRAAAVDHMRYTQKKDPNGNDRWVLVPMSATEADESDLQLLTSDQTPSRTPTNPFASASPLDASSFPTRAPPTGSTFGTRAPPAEPTPPAPRPLQAGFTDALATRASSPYALDRGALPSAEVVPNVSPARASKLAGQVQNTLPGAGQPTGPTTSNGAPAIDRTKIDAILGGLNTYANDIYALSQDNTGQSAAEAQLYKADQLAKIRARDELAANQAGAMGAARSARNRGDRALLERQAVGEQAYLGSQAQRQDTLRQAELEGNLATVRATEADADRRFKLDALSKAADLGLNTAALETDIGKANLASSTQLLNNTFQEMLAQKQIDESQYEALLVHDDRQMQNILAYTQAMAAIQFQYDQMSVQDQQALDQLMMQKYQIDTQKVIALKQIKEQGKFQWDEVLGKFVGGVGQGTTGGVFSLFTGNKGGGTTG